MPWTVHRLSSLSASAVRVRIVVCPVISGPASSWFLLFLIMWSRSKVKNLMWKQKWIHYDLFSAFSSCPWDSLQCPYIEHRAVVSSRWNTEGILRYSTWPITSQRIPQKNISCPFYMEEGWIGSSSASSTKHALQRAKWLALNTFHL